MIRLEISPKGAALLAAELNEAANRYIDVAETLAARSDAAAARRRADQLRRMSHLIATAKARA